ncbi:hypothetical protein M8J76_012142 [Diaphorina citri]|nr:hypothetical protein M8J76_012142 [Diaphorina citri]
MSKKKVSPVNSLEDVEPKDTHSKPDHLTLSVYDIIKKNMAKAQRDTFLFQMMYIGSFTESLGHMTIYKLISEDLEVIGDEDYSVVTGLLLIYKNCFINKITDLEVIGDEDYSVVTGLLLIYKNCFINKITCSQEVAYDHFTKLLNSGLVTNLRVLHYWPHVTQRQFKNWYMVYVTPLMAEEEDNADIRDTTATVLDTFTQFNKLTSYLEIKSKGYLQASVTEKLISEVPHLIPGVQQVLFCCHQNCLRSVPELLEDYHQIRHPKFHTDEVWPLPRGYDAMWSSTHEDDAASRHEQQDFHSM